MAHMVPPQLVDAHASEAERRVFSLLAHDLPDEFFCYHSREVLRLGVDGVREGEIDFVILHATYGLLALEVKGGGLARDGRGQWTRVSPDGTREALRKDPFAQARANLHALVDILEHRLGAALPEWGGKLKLPFGHAIVLPDVRLERAAGLLDGASRELVLDADALGSLHDRIAGAMRLWSRGKPAIDARSFKRFRKDVFLPSLNLVPTLASLFRRDEASLVCLTDQQQRVLEVAASVPRVRLEGPAGSGKTILAAERARRFAAQGKRTCLLCYNRPLAEAIAAPLGEEAEGLMVSTYHGLCRLAAARLVREFSVPKSPEEEQTFWRDKAPDFLFDAVSEGALSFDAVVVDEAQDLETEWWVTVEALVPAAAPLWVFYDPGQDIYGRAASMPEGLVPLALTANCRSTRALRRLCDALSGRETTSPDFAPEGQPHEELRFTSASDLRAKLEARIVALRKQGLDPCQIAILSPHRQQKSSLADVTSLAGHPIVTRREERGILFSTVRRFKGLEADVVLLIDQDRDDPECTAVHRYVAASRARHLLVVFGRGAWLR
jgi:hypothetical protein